jgi:G:T-mismatch repair DNA endonuclease (very short patch repair protein)
MLIPLFRVVVGGINIIWSGCWWYQHYLEWLLVVSTLFGVVVGGINIIWRGCWWHQHYLEWLFKNIPPTTTPNNVDTTNNHSK